MTTPGSYRPSPFGYAYLFERRIRQDLKKASPFLGKSVLDLGCGRQPYREFYESGRTIITFDPQPGLGGVSARAVAEHVPVRSESVDSVLMLAALGCSDDPLKSIGEVSRVLRPGGRALISEHQSWHSYGEGDRFFFRGNAFRHFAAVSGLRLLELIPQGSWWMRTGIRINRAILPFGSSRWVRLSPLLYPFVILNNALFGLLDRLFPWHGEVVAWLAIYEKPLPSERR